MQLAAAPVCSMQRISPGVRQLAAKGRQALGPRRAASTVAAASGTYDGTKVSPPAKGHHFLHIDDFSKEQLSEWG